MGMYLFYFFTLYNDIHSFFFYSSILKRESCLNWLWSRRSWKWTCPPLLCRINSLFKSTNLRRPSYSIALDVNANRIFSQARFTPITLQELRHIATLQQIKLIDVQILTIIVQQCGWQILPVITAVKIKGFNKIKSTKLDFF